MRDRERTIENIMALLRQNGCNVGDACRSAQISRQTFYVWLNEDQAYMDKYIEVRENVLDNVETAVYKEALAGNITAAALILNARGKSRGYGMRDNHENALASGNQVLIIEVPSNPLLRGEEVDFESLPPEFLPEISK